MSIITEIENVAAFTCALAENPGIIVLKLGATWCGPCKMIAKQAHTLMNNIMASRTEVVCYDVDVDESETSGGSRAMTAAALCRLQKHTANIDTKPLENRRKEKKKAGAKKKKKWRKNLANMK